MHPKQRAIKTNSQAYHPHMLKGHDDHESQIGYYEQKLNGKKLAMRPHQYIIKNIIHRIAMISPQTTVPSTLLVDGGKVDFMIKEDHFYVRDLVLQLTVTNSSATTTQRLTPTHMLFDRVRLKGMGSSEIILLEGLDMFSSYCTFHTQNQIHNERFEVNINPTAFTAIRNITAGSTAIFHIPLLDIFPRDGNEYGFPLFNTKHLQLEFTFRGSDAIEVDSSGGDGLPLVVNDLQLIMNVTQFDQKETLALSKIHDINKTYRYLYYNNQKFSVALAGGQSYSFRLSSIKGLSPYCWLYLLPQSHTGQNSYNPGALGEWLDEIEFLDENNSSLTNGHIYKGAYLKNYQSARKLDNVFLSVASTAYFVSFGSNPLSTYHESIVNGFEFFDNNNIKIKTTSSLASVNYELVVIVPTFALLHIQENGHISKEN